MPLRLRITQDMGRQQAVAHPGRVALSATAGSMISIE